MKKTKSYNIYKAFGHVDSCATVYEDYIKDFASSIKKSRVIDIGCGLGNLTELYCINSNRVIGLDILDFRDMRFCKKFEFLKYSGEKMPFKNSSFDVVVSHDTIEHVKNDELFAQEIKRILKPNGTIFIITPNGNRVVSLIKKCIGIPDRFPMLLQEEGIGGKSFHEREYTDKELLNLFKNAGFSNLSIDYLWFGIRGRINIGFKKFFMKKLCQYSQYIILTNKNNLALP